MQVPGKLALIGGSILLSSTLVFTLKSQASTLITHVGQSTKTIYDNVTQTQDDLLFNNYYQQAQKTGRPTGTWGTAKWYIDNKEGMHVGRGDLSGGLYSVIGSGNAASIRSLSFDLPAQAPEDSSFLLSTSSHGLHPYSSLTTIKQLRYLDTSHVQSMNNMFSFDTSLEKLDGIQDWNVSNVDDMMLAFYATHLSNLDLSGWRTSHLRTANHIFTEDANLRGLNIQGFDTSHGDTDYLFGGTWGTSAVNLNQLSLGDKTLLSDNDGLPDSNWTNGKDTVSVHDLVTHSSPGTWTKVRK